MIYDMFTDGTEIMIMETTRDKDLMGNITTDEEPIHLRNGTSHRLRYNEYL